MKKVLLLCFFSISLLSAYAQSVSPVSIEDSVIGWMKMYHFKGINQLMKLDGKSYSVAQLSICDSLANWMQASYVPKGGLGDVKRSVSEKLGTYNQNTASLPQSYGAVAKTYTFLKYNSKGRLVPENSLGVSWGIMANAVPGWEIRDISSPSQYYFTMPSFETAFDSNETKKVHDLSGSSNLKPYINFWIKNIEAGNGTDYVLLSKDNRSPFIKLTKGEYLQVMEETLPVFRGLEKKKIDEANRGNQKNIDYFTKTLDEKIERFRSGLKNNREKYKNRLEEIALTGAQPALTDLDNGRDVFSNGYLSDIESVSGRMPVYKVDPAIAELCKTNQPQWILVSWWWTPNIAMEKYMHESIINNFNFAYLYNFFFDPQKVKGQPYKPLRSPTIKEAVVAAKASEANKNNSSDKNIHFFEDFSTTGIGKNPIGWQTKSASDGSRAIVTRLDGLDGNWVELRGHYINATSFKKPLPQNFILSYELVATQNFTWGAKGLTLHLSKETSPGNAESYLKLKLRPGYNGSDGEATLEAKFPAPPGYLNVTKWYVANGFSNNKKNNRVTVAIKKSEEKLEVFIDKIKIAEFEKAIPLAHLFNALSFECSGNSDQNDTFYIGNIKITKD